MLKRFIPIRRQEESKRKTAIRVRHTHHHLIAPRPDMHTGLIQLIVTIFISRNKQLFVLDVKPLNINKTSIKLKQTFPNFWTGTISPIQIVCFDCNLSLLVFEESRPFVEICWFKIIPKVDIDLIALCYLQQDLVQLLSLDAIGHLIRVVAVGQEGCTAISQMNYFSFDWHGVFQHQFFYF